MSEILDEVNVQTTVADNLQGIVTIQQIGHIVEQLAPKHLAESWDNVGLMVGQQKTAVTSILTALDVTDEVVEEAIAKGCNLIVSHHPLIFKGLKQVTDETDRKSVV